MLRMKGSELILDAGERLKSVFRRAASEDLESLSQNELEVFQAMARYINAATEVVIEREKALKQIDDKLDELNKLLLEKGRV